MNKVDYYWEEYGKDLDFRYPYDKCPHCGEYKLVMVKYYDIIGGKWIWQSYKRGKLIETYLKCKHCGYYKKEE